MKNEAGWLKTANLFGCAAVCAYCLSIFSVEGREVRNIVVFVGDGMGVEHMRAAEMWSGSNLQFRSFPSQASIATCSADSEVTDSAAAATAFATGQKVNNGVISVALPGDGASLETLLEYFKKRGKRTGLITTSYLTDATPAAFGAHEASRNNRAEIAADYLTASRPDLLLGGGGQGLTAAAVLAAGYNLATDAVQMASAPAPLCGLFGDGSMPYEYDGLGGLPHLSEMVARALTLLNASTNGFFLLAENGLIDHAAHGNDLARCLPEVIEFSRAVDIASAWARDRSDTLLMVLADHETGGLQVTADNGVGNLPTVAWSTAGHTSSNVTVYAKGALAERMAGISDNTDVHGVPRGSYPAWYSLSLKKGVLVWADNLGISAAVAVPGDYDGDGKDDFAVYNTTGGVWFIRTVAGISLAWRLAWGAKGGIPVPGDYDGDGLSDLAIYNPKTSRWRIGTLDGTILAWNLAWGYSNTIPVPGDYDGDGQADLAIHDSSTGAWFIRTMAGGVLAWGMRWGFPGEKLVPGDYDGDGRTDLAVYDPTGSKWYIRRLGGGVLAWGAYWGYAGVAPVSGDYDGDGKADLMIYDNSRGLWYGRALSGGLIAWGTRWGYAAASPYPGDIDGDGRSDLTVVDIPK